MRNILNKKIYLLVLSMLVIFFGYSVTVFAQGEGWTIDSFSSDIQIQQDGSILVTETLDVDFLVQKHGIFRFVPYVYENENSDLVYTAIDVIGVNIDGSKVPYDESKSGWYVNLKIGDPDKTITGKHTYEITYSVVGILRSFYGYDELYFNTTGSEWEVPIERSNAIVTLPRGKILQIACYFGVQGSADNCKESSIVENVASFNHNQILLANEALTIAVGFEQGIVPIIEVSAPTSFAELFLSPVTLVSFIVIFLLNMNYLLKKWWRHGRDKWWKRKALLDEDKIEQTMPIGGHETIVVEYDPPNNLRPGEIGVIKDETADTLDVSASIVHLAVRGYIEITEIEKKWMFGTTDYTLKKMKEPKGSELLGYEILLLNSLFNNGDEVKLSELKNTFFTSLKKVKDELYEEVTKKGLFTKNPSKARNTQTVFVIMFFIGAFVLMFVAIALPANNFYIAKSVLIGIIGAMFLSFVPALIVARAMPQRTAQGREVYRNVKGYELFLGNVEKHRQQFFERENVFMDVLPYVIMFGLTKKLSSAMKELGVQPTQPIWYHGAIGNFSMDSFSNSIDSFSKSLSTSIASAPSSTGSGRGGFSGGGFGGGGGGSW